MKETITAEMFAKVCAERDAFRDLCGRMAISMAVQRFGTIGHGKNIVIGDYVFHVSICNGEAKAEVRS